MRKNMLAPSLVHLSACLFLISIHARKYIPTYAGPYKVLIESVTRLSEERNRTDDIVVDVLVQHTIGDGRYVYGKSENKIPVDDNLKIHVIVDKRSNNEWKENFFVLNFQRVCTSCRHHAPKILEMGFGEDGKHCPVKPAKRIIPNQTLNVEFPAFPVAPYGFYRVRFILTGKDGSRKGGFVAEANFVPRVS